MKALSAKLSVRTEAWDRVKAKLFRKTENTPAVYLELGEIPEPDLIGPDWVKVRSIVSGISDLDESVALNGDPLPFSSFITFPYVPGNENVGIVTEIGNNVQGIELGERVVINPLLSCRTRGIDPPCVSCASGNPSSCHNFGQGAPGPGVIIGACKSTFGGWADSFIAHKSQVRMIPHSVETDLAIMVPEFARALRAVLQHSPSAGDTVVIVGAGSLGLLTLIALQMTGYKNKTLVLAEHPFEGDLARKFSNVRVAFTQGHGTAFEEVSEFVGGIVRYPETGRPAIAGGADLVYETTGTKQNVEDALYLTGERKKLVLMGMRAISDLDPAPLWFKALNVVATSFSGKESDSRETFDMALEMALEGCLPIADLVTHRFSLQDYRQAFGVLRDRSVSKAVKVMFQHVV
ncbi:MAG: alcohol dehydrogenase catalytic domain-containing protein [Desulfomonile tiedjei]|uniref:Alcohol dehydrogenase catalytic domain-containing protein n=1 Tax=Desulfomonile tiedjei TaxID=2358 RepID=A0A9D6VC40_9BACT|nr:alcohol dehydrogenase catalytic domain-containing protein [Desulfomonile tiedjei]